MSPSEHDLEQIYRRCRQQLFTCALVVTGCPARAEDAIQQAFYQLFRRNSRPGDLKAYVFRAVRNAALDQVRRRETPADLLPEFIFDPAIKPDESAEQREFCELLTAGLQALHADERETIVQHVYGGLTFREIAEVREIALGTVVSWYRRGLEKLREKLEKVNGPV